MKEAISFDEEKWYSTSQVVNLARQGYFPFKSLNLLYKIIKSGKISVIARGENTKKKFFIQGKELTRYANSQQITIQKSNGKQMQKSSTKA